MTSGAERRCGKHHDVVIEWEEGGTDKTTLLGRWFCVKCDAEFVAAIDAREAQRNVR